MNDKKIIEQFVDAPFKRCIEMVWDHGIGREKPDGQDSNTPLWNRPPWTRGDIKKRFEGRKQKLSGEVVGTWKSKPSLKPRRDKVDILCAIIEESERAAISGPVTAAIRMAWEDVSHGDERESEESHLRNLGLHPDQSLLSLVGKLGKLQNGRLVIVGPTYVDIDINKVPPRAMSRNVEHASAEHGEPRLGGSGIKFAEQWKRLTGQKSDLITAIARDKTPLVALHKALLDGVCEVDGPEFIGQYEDIPVRSGPPLSITLNHKETQASTTITSKQGLEGIVWPSVLERLGRFKHDANIIVLSGLEKTPLTDGLVTNLSSLAPQYFIVLDIGRLDPVEHEKASRGAIVDALAKGFVDIAFGTYMEYMRLNGQPLPRTDNGKFEIGPRLKKLESLQVERSPKSSVCVLRDFNFLKEDQTANAKGVIQLVVLVGGTKPINLSDRILDKPRSEGFSRSARAFDARVLQGMIAISSRTDEVRLEDFEQMVVDAANGAFVE